jgi:hypothetical protein
VVSAVFLLALCAAALLGQTPSVVGRSYTPFVWIERKTVVPDQAQLPDSVRVFEGFASYEDGAPLRAWYVDVDYNDKSLAARSFLSNDPSGKEVASSMARKVGALVAINGGYFDMSSQARAHLQPGAKRRASTRAQHRAGDAQRAQVSRDA